MERLDLLVIACAGRANLLMATLATFCNRWGARWGRRLITIDGHDLEMERVAQSYQFRILRRPDNRRVGLLRNMITGYQALEGELAFVCEDDWALLGRLPLERMVEAMRAEPALSQVRPDKPEGLTPGSVRRVGRQVCGFPLSSGWHTFNPHLCRPADFLHFAGLAGLGVGIPTAEEVAAVYPHYEKRLEHVYARHMQSGRRLFATVERDQAMVVHLGTHAATDRRWHLI